MQTYNYLQAIYSSFYSRDLYKDVNQNWGAGVVVYLLLVLAICWAITMVPMQEMITQSFEKFSQKVVPQLPIITVKNGIVSTPENRPYIIKDEEKKENIMVVDTSGQYTNLDEANAQILLTKKEVMIKDNSNEVRTQKLPKTLNMVIEPQVAKQKLERIIDWAWVILFPLMLAASFAYRLVQSFVYAIFGKIYAVLANIPLRFVNVMKLSMVAVTPAIILSTILDWFLVSFRLQLLVYFLLTMIYLIFAIRATHTEGLK